MKEACTSYCEASSTICNTLENISQFFIHLMAVQTQIPCSCYCILVIVFIYQILVWKSRITFLWQHPFSINLHHLLIVCIHILWISDLPITKSCFSQDQYQITGFWFCRPFTWKYQQHMNIFFSYYRSASIAVRQRRTVLLWHIVGQWEVWQSPQCLVFIILLYRPFRVAFCCSPPPSARATIFFL